MELGDFVRQDPRRPGLALLLALIGGLNPSYVKAVKVWMAELGDGWRFEPRIREELNATILGARGKA